MGNHESAMLAIDERSTNRRKIVLSVAVLLAAVAVLIGGAFATFTNTATAGPQALNELVINGLQTNDFNDTMAAGIASPQNMILFQ